MKSVPLHHQNNPKFPGSASFLQHNPKRIPYQELGANYFDTLDRERLTKHTVKRLEALGYEVTLTPKEVSCTGYLG